MRYSASADVRQVVSAPIAAKLGLSASNTISLTVAQYVAIPQGNDYIPNGSYLQDTLDGQIGEYSNGTFRLVSQQVAGILKLTQSQIIEISDQQYTSLMKPSEYYPDGIYVENLTTGDISLYSGGELHYLTPAVVAQVQPPLSNTAIVTAADYTAIPMGSNYTPPTS